MSRLDLFVLVAALVNLTVVVEFVRRRRLLETFALLWIVVGLMGGAAALGRTLLDDLADFAGIDYGASFILASACAFLLFVCMSLSLHVSRLEAKTEVLAEEVAMLHGVREPEPPPAKRSARRQT
jgi:hypothetical protein